MRSRLKKLLGSSSLIGLPALLKAGWGLVILIVLVVAIAIAICILLKRLSDIPPIDREKQIGSAPMSQGDMWAYYTNHGLPPSFNYVQGVEPWPMDYWTTHPLTNNGVVYDYFELVSVAPAAPHVVMVCSRLGTNWTELATVGTGTNLTGFTNQDFEVSSVGGQWEIKPTRYALTNYTSMFWTALPR
jgi:hypothetical protein